jgi:outer membrane lipopolysaccharide assembly protein LptE/RlpB
MKIRKLKLLPLLVCLVLLSACGYELIKEKGIYGGAITSLSIPVFKNRSFEPQAPGFFTEAFSLELAASGLFEINKAGSDASLQGTITSITATPASLGSSGLAVQKIVTAMVNLTLTKQGNVVKTWTFSDAEVYDVPDVNLEDFNKRAALQRIAARIARRFRSQLVAIY